MTRARLLAIALSGVVAAAAMVAIGHAASLPVDSATLDAFAADQAAPTTTVPSDSTPPTVGATEFYDSNANGRIDQIKLTYSEALAATSATAPWTIAGGPAGLASTDLNLVSVSSNVVTLSFDEAAGTATAVTTTAPSLTVSLDNTSGAIKDLATPPNAAASFSNRATTDKAAPALVTLEAFDDRAPGAANGKIDRVAATFSETLAGYTAGTGVWTLDNAPGGAGNTVSSVSVSGSVATLNLAEGVVNTSLGSGATAFRIDLATSATGIRDAVGNTTTFTDALVADQAAPVFLDFADSDTTGASPDGLFENDDWIEFTFSEPINLSTTTNPADVQLIERSGNNNDEFAIEGLIAATSLGANNYISDNNQVATYADSDLTLVNGARTIHVELSSCTPVLPADGPCGTDRTAGQGTVSLTIVANTVKGTDGLFVVGTVSKTAYRMM